MKKYKKAVAWTTLLAMIGQPLNVLAAVTISPTTLPITSISPVCTGGTQNIPLSITLPSSAITDKVDVFFSFDDTGSFTSVAPSFISIASGLMGALETALPGVEFGFGVGRFEDYGGPGSSFSRDLSEARPFILNQPIVTAATAGGSVARDALVNSALSRTAPGFGGDGPESSVAENLYQIAVGTGFDGDGNGSTLDSGNAGDTLAQTSPGISGDVPPFASNTALTSGTLGGVGWRRDALHLAIMATDVCPVAAFPANQAIPASITSAGGTSVPVSAFACGFTTAGSSRFGFVSDSKSLFTNTVAGAVAPLGAGTVQGTVDALNALGIRVIGMGPGAAPVTTFSSVGSFFDPSPFLSALATLTGAVDASGTPLVFSTSVLLTDLSTAIANAITTTATKPVDIEVTTTSLPVGLTTNTTPALVTGVSPGGTANFDLILTGDGSAISGGFDVQFKDKNSGALLGTIPTTVDCTPTTPVGDAYPPVIVITTTIDTATGSATDNRPSEDLNSNGILDAGEDINANGQIDKDTGIASVTLDPSSTNLVLTVSPFTPGDPSVNFSLALADPNLPGSGAVIATDVAGNSSSEPVSLENRPLAFNFSNFKAKVETEKKKSELEAEGSFILDLKSDGINPITEIVTFKIGSIEKTIPANSFKLNSLTQTYHFEGLIGGKKVEASIKPTIEAISGFNGFIYELVVYGVAPASVPNVVNVELSIGNDSASAANIKVRRR